MPSQDVIKRNPHIYAYGVTDQAETKESDLHHQIIEYCKGRRWITFHGSTAHRAMRTIGEPDFQILANEGRMFLVECKTKTGKLSNEQRGLQLVAEMLGHKIHVVRSFKEFVQLVNKPATSFPTQAP